MICAFSLQIEKAEKIELLARDQCLILKCPRLSPTAQLWLCREVRTHLIHLCLCLLQTTVAGEVGGLIRSICRGSSWGRPGDEKQKYKCSVNKVNKALF